MQGWITFNQKKIQKDVTYVIRKIENEGWIEKFQKFFVAFVPVMGGLSGGFYYGF